MRTRFLAGLFVLSIVLAWTSLAASSPAQFPPEWVSRVPLGTSLAAGIAGIHVDPDGVSYITGISGSSSNNNITTVSFAPDGSTRWSQTWNSPGSKPDSARGITKDPNGVIYVVGSTLGPNSFAAVLILAYDAATGALLDTIQYSSDNFTSEYGVSIVTDAAGNLYVLGATVGDATDAMILKFNSGGVLQWRQTWDGPAFGPFSNDAPVKILLDPSGNVLVAIVGEMASNHPDYVVVKYAAANGTVLWDKRWGVSGGDFIADMEVDAAGDVYASGIGIDFIDKFSTIKLRGTDGALLWQFYDEIENDHSVSGLFLDGVGGVFVTGASDPEGDHSNFNDNFFTVKRDAATGALLWTHSYGDDCVGCYDIASDVRVDPAGNVFVIGWTTSPPFSNDIILFVLDTDTGLEINRGQVLSSGTETFNSGALRFDAEFNLYDGGRVYNANTGAVDMSVTKWASLIDGGGGIPCADMVSFRARCKATSSGRNLQARLTLSNTNHAGESVTLTVDGQPFVLTINGSKAQLSAPETTTGPHTVELTDPAGCFPPQVVNCPAE